MDFMLTTGEGIMTGIEMTDIGAGLDLVLGEDLNKDQGQDLPRCRKGEICLPS